MEPALWGLLGTLVGAAASLLTTLLSNRHSERLHAAAKAVERQEAARAFQRQTLLELQEAFHDAIRLVCESQVSQADASNKGAPWSITSIPDDVGERARLANRKVLLLVGRVASDEVRREVEAVMLAADAAIYMTSRDDAIAHLDAAVARSVAAIRVMGQVLRSLY